MQTKTRLESEIIAKTMLLEDILYILKKLDDENTYRIHAASPVMAESIEHLIESIKRAIQK